MDYFDKHMKDLLDQSESLPGEFAWEEMEAGIQTKMSEIKDDENNRRPIFWIWASLGMLLIVGCIGYGFWTTNTKVDTLPTQKTNAPSIKETSASIHEEYEISNSLMNDEIADIGNKEVKLNFQSLKIIERSKDVLDKSLTYVNEINVKNTRSNTSESLYKTDTEIVKGQEEIPSKNQLNDINSESKFLDESRIIMLNGLADLQSRVEYNNEIETLPYTFSTLTKVKKDESPVLNQALQLSAGITYWATDFGVSEEYESEFASYGLGLRYHRGIGKNYFLNTGLDYQNYVSEFRWEGQISHQIEVKDTVTSVQVNLITSDTSYVYGNATGTYTADRRVLNYNNFRMFSIPVSFGRTQDLGNLKWDVSIGIDLGLLQMYHGKTLRNESVLEYTNDNAPFRKSIQFASVIENRLRYPISQSWDAMISFQFKQQHRSWSEEVQKRPSQIFLSAGFSLKI